jgi:hypothetical protein
LRSGILQQDFFALKFDRERTNATASGRATCGVADKAVRAESIS